MKTLIKFFAAILFATLMVVNFNVIYELSPFDVQVDIEMNEANASTIEDDYRLEDETCWETGEDIQVCRYAQNMICDVSAQDTCSSSDPVENWSDY